MASLTILNSTSPREAIITPQPIHTMFKKSFIDGFSVPKQKAISRDIVGVAACRTSSILGSQAQGETTNATERRLTFSICIKGTVSRSAAPLDRAIDKENITATGNTFRVI